MIIRQTFLNAQCDGCGCEFDEENWYPKDVLDDVMRDANWKILGGRHYCEDCWRRDDNDNIVTSDGRKWTDGGEEIKD